MTYEHGPTPPDGADGIVLTDELLEQLSDPGSERSAIEKKLLRVAQLADKTSPKGDDKNPAVEPDEVPISW
ncbi:MAG: hypothetical protein WA030_00965 [Candidatus Microsaccharimonas sp.]